MSHTEYLPLGSVVLLRNSTKPLMIFGRLLDGVDGATHDYVACTYPEGFYDEDEVYVFAHEAVTGLLHRGFVDDEEKAIQQLFQQHKERTGGSTILEISQNEVPTMENQPFLPLGSVVRLVGGTKKLVIYGRGMKKETGEHYDYIGCPYPEGFLNPERAFVFNQEAIEEVIHRGYSDEEDEQAQLILQQFRASVSGWGKE